MGHVAEIAADKVNETVAYDDHPDHHNTLADAINTLYDVAPYSPIEYGAVYGTGASLAQATINREALQSAILAATVAGQGTIRINGTLLVDGTVELVDLVNAKVAIEGVGGNTGNAAIKLHASADPVDYLLTLKGSRQVNIHNLTLDANSKARVALYCARTGTQTSGKHYFENVYATGATVASHLNWGSEENTYLKCRFQNSPIGCFVTGFQPDLDNAATRGVDPIVAGQRDLPRSIAAASNPGNWNDSTAHHFYDCAFGSSASSRCGLLVQSSELLVFGGAVQTQVGAEAGCIIDGTRQGAVFTGLVLDSGLPLVGWKVGYFSTSLAGATNFSNQMAISGGSWTINAASGTAYMNAKNLVGCVIGPLTVGGPTPAASYGINLNDNACRSNLFMNVVYNQDQAGTAVTVTNAGTAADNIQIAQGKITFIAPSGSTSAVMGYSQPLTIKFLNRIQPQPSSVGGVGLGLLVQGESAERLQVLGNGQLQWSDGTNAVDVTLRRSGADILRTDDAFYADLGLRPDTTSSVVTHWEYKRHLTGAAAITFGTVAAHGTKDLTMTPASLASILAANVNKVEAAPVSSMLPAGLVFGGAVVTADGTVTVRVANVTDADIVDGGRSWRADVWEH